MRITSLTLLAGAALALSGCAYNGLGMGVGYDPYGSYGSPYGYGSGYGYGAGYGYGSGYGYGYGSPYRYGSPYAGYGYDPFGRYGYGYAPFGWYNNYYYPGSGHYVYDRDNKPRQMTPAEQALWRKRVAEVLANRIRQNGEVTTNSSGVTTQQAMPSGSVATAPRPVRTRDTVRTHSEQRSSTFENRRAAAEDRRSAAEERRSARREAVTARRASREND